MSEKKKSLREIYRDSADRIGLALELFGSQTNSAPPHWPNDEQLDSVQRLINNVVIAQDGESENNYSVSMSQVGRWLCGATKKTFLKDHQDKNPHGHYVVRKGLEVMHMLLHRDLRRKLFSSTESQVYYNFVRLTSHLPNPSCEPHESQEEDKRPRHIGGQN